MRLRAGVSSHCGLVRPTNEDSYLVRQGLYVVCDGMGGARAGEVASEMACRGLLTLDPAGASATELRDAVVEVDKAISRRSAEEHGLLGMGTTLTALLAGEGFLTVAHVGDSRAYLLHEGVLSQVTDDHSWVGEMVRRGELTPAQAAAHPHRSIITKALGTDSHIEPDVFAVPVVARDRALLCTDGLSGMLSDADIAAILSGDEDAQGVADLLVQAALTAGGEDNVTVVVVDIGAADVSSPLEPGGEEAQAVDDSEGQAAGDSVAADDGRAREPLAGADPAAGDAREPLGGADGLAAAGDPAAAPDRGAEDILLGPVDRGLTCADRTAGDREHGLNVSRRLGRRVALLRRPPGGHPGEALTVDAAATGTETAPETAAPPEPSKTGASAASPDKAPDAKLVARGWTRRRWLTLASVVVAIIILVVVGFVVFNSTVYYVGVFEGGVALYHGLPGFSSVVERGTVSYDSLAPHLRSRVDAHELLSKEEGQQFLRSLSAQQ